MKIGMYSVELQRPSVEELFDAIRDYGYSQVQFNFASILPEELPAEIPRVTVERVAAAADKSGVEIAAVNGTFNMIHPDLTVRRAGLERFTVAASAARMLGAPLLTLCTGTRSLEGMWRRHNDNTSDAAWRDLLAIMEQVVTVAEREELILGIECEASNVVSSPRKARLLLDELASERVKIIMDPANLFAPGEAQRDNVRRVIGDAFDLLGADIVLAHGKDLLEGQELHFTSAGRGIVDFDFFLDQLAAVGYDDGIVLHGAKTEPEVAESIEFMRRTLAAR